LPGTLWITEVHLDVGVQAEAFVISHLFASIPGQRLVELSRYLVGLLNECVDHRLCIFARHPAQHDKPCVALYQCRDLTVVAAEQQVTFPVTRYGAVLNLGRTFPDRDCVADPAVILCLLRVMT